jgi:hypothetical protein
VKPLLSIEARIREMDTAEMRARKQPEREAFRRQALAARSERVARLLSDALPGGATFGDALITELAVQELEQWLRLNAAHLGRNRLDALADGLRALHTKEDPRDSD